MKTQERSEGHKTFARLMSREPSCTPLSLDTQGHSGHSLTVMHTFTYTHRHSTLMDTQGHSCTHSYTLTDTRAHGHSCALEDIHTHHEHMRVRGHSDTR